MAIKQGRHKSVRGKVIDMDALRTRNQYSVAIGNTNMNARGDILGPAGNIVVRREQIIQSYYKNNPNGVKRASLKDISPQTFETPQQAIERLKPKKPEPPKLDVPHNVVGKHKGRTLIDKKD